MPCGQDEIDALVADGVTHVVNCRADLQVVISQDMWMEQRAFGHERVTHAAMWDNGKPKEPSRWEDATMFAVNTLQSDPDAKVLIHCQQGRRRSAMVAYAALRLRGHDSAEAARLVLNYRSVARIVPAYRTSVEKWLEAVALSGNVGRPTS